MRYLILLIVITDLACSHQTKIRHLPYPRTRTVDTVDTYFGERVADPYRWLEDDNSAETAAWVKAENKVTQDYLSKIALRPKIKKRLEALWNYPKFGIPFKRGDYYFFSKNDGMQNQSVVYIQKGINGAPAVFLDPNRLSEDGTVALSGLSVDHNAQYAAYAIARSGSDWNEIFVKDVRGRKTLSDHLKWVKFSGMSWQGNGFYYSRYPEPRKSKALSGKNKFHKVYYHRIGDPQSADRLVFEDATHPFRTCYAQTTRDEAFLIIFESEGTSGSALYLQAKGQKSFTPVVTDFNNDYSVIDHLNGRLLVMTNRDAPRWRLVQIDPKHPAPANWKTLIPESKDVLKSVVTAGDKIIATYMQDVKSAAYLFDMDGKPAGTIKLPGIGTLTGFNGQQKDNTAFYGFTSFTFPTTIYKFDVKNNRSAVYHQPKISFDAGGYESRQVFYKSKDGTRIPMFLTYKKGMEQNGANPTLLYAYGGFDISITPGFRVTTLALLEKGFIYAVPNIRGGGEYGEAWHKAGTKMHKQNVFDDFIAAAEYLIKEGYTSPQKLAVSGRSNGGLLIGACMTQRPDLFRVALPGVGVMDMLRYQKFTIGWAWASDYGRSDDSKEMFEYLYHYSPLHNIKKGVSYPATLITTADHDDRVVPAHSFKFAATLQAAQAGDNPVLIRIDHKAGHGGGKPTAKIIDEYADLWAFVMYNLDAGH